MNTKSDCIFCQIISKRVPADVVYEDEDTLVIENIKRITEGQNLLIIPKRHVKNYLDCEDSEILKVHSVARWLKEHLNLDHLCLWTNYKAPYQTVFHAHYHLKTGKFTGSQF